MTDHRMGLDLITDMLGVLDRHGYTRGDNEHTGRAILLIGDLAHIYEGSQDHPFGPYIGEITAAAGTGATRTGHATTPSPCRPARSRPSYPPWIIAADYKRDRAELCADCADQSCPTCEWRLRDAQAYDRAHAQLLQSAEASAAASHPEPAAEPAADREAGQ